MSRKSPVRCVDCGLISGDVYRERIKPYGKLEPRCATCFEQALQHAMREETRDLKRQKRQKA